MDVINVAFANKEKLDFNVYVGKTEYGNICLCLDNDGKITYAFPTVTNKADYVNIKEKINEIGLGRPDEMHLQVVTLFFCVDLLNNKDIIIKKINCLVKKKNEKNTLMYPKTYIKKALSKKILSTN